MVKCRKLSNERLQKWKIIHTINWNEAEDGVYLRSNDRKIIICKNKLLKNVVYGRKCIGMSLEYLNIYNMLIIKVRSLYE